MKEVKERMKNRYQNIRALYMKFLEDSMSKIPEI
jgi:hypothetical protein